MSAIRLSSPSRSAVGRAPSLRAVASVKNKSKAAVLIKVVLIGFVAIQILKLFVDITVSQSAYELKNLKLEKIALTTQSEIIAQQVDSLGSQQNLANSAASLGMIANANPVFLRIEDKKVFGKPKEALNSDGRVAKNNIADAALVQHSVLTGKVPTANDGSVNNADVGRVSGVNPPVAFSGGTIPTSPTH